MGHKLNRINVNDSIPEVVFLELSPAVLEKRLWNS